MLAAAMDVDSSLSMFRTILSTIGAEPADRLSSAVRTKVVEVLQQASVIARDPSCLTSETPSEAIELAVRLIERPDLRDDLAQVRDFDAIQPDLARKVLLSIDSLVSP